MKKFLSLFAIGFLLCSFAVASEAAQEQAPESTTSQEVVIDFDALDAGECSVSVTCEFENGTSSVGCSTSTGNCSSGPDWVECDGERKTCANPSNFCTARLFDFANRCFLFCSSTQGDCVEGSDFISCDGVVETCD